MRSDLTDITIVLDRTGSMEPIRDDTIGGFNRFVEDQKTVGGACTLTLAQFDSQDPYEVIWRATPIAEVPTLTRDRYVPRAATPLLDAIGRGINDTGSRLAALPEGERPGKVVFVVITDGLENASREFKKATIKEMIEKQQTVYKWEFVFLGANMDAVQEGAAMGVPMANAMTNAHDAEGIKAAYSSLSATTASYRSGQATNMAWSQEDRNKQRRGRV